MRLLYYLDLSSTLTLALALALARTLPLTRWLFKYSDSNPSGIGIHADPAAVNFNLWLTQG